jgi:threonine/homoserine/homoserine lactone efflux protein
MAASSVATFWLIAILLIIVPGPDWAFTLSAGLRGGSLTAAVGGLAIGYAAITSVVAAGVGTWSPGPRASSPGSPWPAACT